jgi:hypothetical protein
VAAPVLLVAAWRAGPAALRSTVVGGVLAALLVAGAYAPFFGGLATFQGLERSAIYSASPAELVVIGLEGAGWPLDRAMSVARLLTVASFSGLVVIALVGLWRGRIGLVTALAAALFGYLLVGSQWFNPWYLLWLLPVALLASDRRIQLLSLSFALLAPLTYVLQYDARLVVPLVFGPVAVLAAIFRAALGWPTGRSLALAQTSQAQGAAGHG